MGKQRKQTEDILLVTQQALAALPSLTGTLVAWYDENKRDLPWRRDPTPYRVWVSEIMLQQTRVEAVREYYRRFVERLPNVASLAGAEDDLLLKLWEGLGYYSRVRNMKKAAQAVMEHHNGAFPASWAGLLALPGIGEYTAGAVASIAFGIPVPAVDGNVYRVLSRILGSYGDTSTLAVKQAFRLAAASMVPEDRPGDFNQSLMELGATVCLPKGQPDCGHCPVRAHCKARESGIAGELPVKAAKKARRVEERTVVLVVARGRVLLFRRDRKGLLPGMYQPLNWEGHLDRDTVVERVAEMGGMVRKIIPLREAIHIFSHVEWHMRGYLVYATPFQEGEGQWVDAAQLEQGYALPSAFRAYTGDLQAFLQQDTDKGGAL